MLGEDCSRKPTNGWEIFDASDLPLVCEAPTDWYLPPLVIEPLSYHSPEPGEMKVDSLESPSTPSNTTDCTGTFEVSTL